ncbi:unnamed protein product [Camellia sinensis]
MWFMFWVKMKWISTRGSRSQQHRYSWMAMRLDYESGCKYSARTNEFVNNEDMLMYNIKALVILIQIDGYQTVRRRKHRHNIGKLRENVWNI